MFRKTVSHLVSCNRIDADIVDDVLYQYDQLKEIIRPIPYTNERLDGYNEDYIDNGRLRQFPDLKKKNLNIILVLSHGNADMERGFSVNREVTVENLEEESLVASLLENRK